MYEACWWGEQRKRGRDDLIYLQRHTVLNTASCIASSFLAPDKDRGLRADIESTKEGGMDLVARGYFYNWSKTMVLLDSHNSLFMW